jgi:hypothetical protein
MKAFYKIIFCLVLCTYISFAQGYQGPAAGKVTGGVTLSTDDFSNTSLPEKYYPSSSGKKVSDEVNFFFSNDELNLGVFSENKEHFKLPRKNSFSINEELNFDGPNSPGCWVPDCNITPGPSDVLVVTNTAFWITDRSGNTIKQISSGNWYSPFVGSGLVFDPKSFYDKRTKRFYMMYLYRDSSINETLIMVSVSDDSTAEGNWNNWSFRADLNGGALVSKYADFPSLIITDDALCVAVDMIPHTGGNPTYSKLRAFQLNDLIAETPGEVNFVDLWDFRNPESQNIPVRTLKLVHDYDFTNNIYLTGFRVNTLPQNEITNFEVNNIWNQVQVNAVNVETSSFRLTPHMTQKGGNTPVQLFHLFYSEMFRRHGKIYIVHSTRDGNLASIHYMEVNTTTWELDNEIFIGGDGYYYGYADLIVDEAGNVFMLYQRTSADEYPGLFYSAKSPESDTFGEDIPLMEGSGNMSLLGCGGTFGYVRFGDYVDIIFDPIEQGKIWMMGQYVASDNAWKTRIGKVSTDGLVNVDEENGVVTEYSLSQNYPNPFNPSTTISFVISKSEYVSLKIFDTLGREIKTLIDRNVAAGKHEVEFNAEGLSSGVYYYQLKSGVRADNKKMIVLK